MTTSVANELTETQYNLFRQLMSYVEILGAPVLVIHGERNGVCSCSKGKDCGKNSYKHPDARFCPNGVKDASTDPDVIKQWVRNAPNANWAIATGKKMPNGKYLVVLDIDPRNGGDESLVEMIKDHGDVPETPYQLTGGNGFHYLLGVKEKPKGTVVCSGIDLKGDGGYIMVAPSLHYSGKYYEWEALHDLTDFPVADAPEWVTYGKQKAPRPPWTGTKARETIIGSAFEAAGWAGVDISEGRMTVHCPWANKHTDGRGRGGDSSTVVLPRSAETPSGGFKCYHEHCLSKSWQDAMAAIPADIAREARAKFRIVTADEAIGGEGKTIITGGLTAQQMSEMRDQLLYGNARANAPAKLKKDMANVVGILKHDPRWKGILSFDSFSNQIMVSREPPWHEQDRPAGYDTNYPRQWMDADDTRLVNWINRFWGIEFEESKVNKGMILAAQGAGTHPVREYLRSLEWDGRERLDSWLSTYCSAEACEYASKAGAWWMISAIARVMDPGCEAHHVLILEGAQGIGKSTVFKILGKKWFTDSGIDLGSKDAYQTIRGRWIIELAELDSLSRSDAARAKAFFTSPIDTYRPSYGRAVVSVPRQCVFAGTVNHSEYLRDETGNRRYWPVACFAVAFDDLERDRDQLWAEAFKRYETGSLWYPSTEDEKYMFANEVRKREFVDSWELEVNRWLSGPDANKLFKDRGYVTVGDGLKSLGITPDRWSSQDMIRMMRALAKLNLDKRREDVDGQTAWVFSRREVS